MENFELRFGLSYGGSDIGKIGCHGFQFDQQAKGREGVRAHFDGAALDGVGLGLDGGPVVRVEGVAKKSETPRRISEERLENIVHDFEIANLSQELESFRQFPERKHHR